MNNIFRYLDEREQEFKRHLSVARMLEARVSEAAIENEIHVEVRHINTIKSGLLVHLYNIVEAISTRTLDEIGREVAKKRPGLWTNAVLSEWVRSEFWSSEERLGNKAFEHLTKLSSKLVSGQNTDLFEVKGVPGSWDDKAIKKIAERLGCNLVISENIKRAACEKVFRNETSALKYLALRRNDLAHGKTTFEDGAYDLTLNDVEGLANRVLPYLKEVTESYENFLKNKSFLKNQEEAA